MRAAVVRLPPTVHGDDDQGFVPQLITLARKKQVAAYVREGQNRWPAVHRLDAARLFRLALEQGEAGHALPRGGGKAIPFRQTAEVLGRHLGVPVAARPPGRLGFGQHRGGR
ncbi:MAG: hypothetical protein WKG07_20520 [Hymenobacter sp.]